MVNPSLHVRRAQRQAAAKSVRAATNTDVLQEAAPALPHLRDMSRWQRVLYHPESLPSRKLPFDFHFVFGAALSLYLFVMSVSGSAIVFRTQLEASQNAKVLAVVERLVDLHANLLAGETGRVVNGVAAGFFTLICITGLIFWWPGLLHWRRSLSVNWRSSLARINWDLHNALGFWSLFFLLVWGASGFYFAFPDLFNSVQDFLEPPASHARFGDELLAWLAKLHFGRFGWFAEIVWALFGLGVAVLAFTGMFMCCHRLLVRKGAPLPR